MKNLIIGTAGHVDHGKTTLIQAMTGRNTDRLQEEQERGITIDLGFTYIDLPNGVKAGIVDVPGHEKFINNMVSGVSGFDVVLILIAADEGIMPQTIEHIDILHLLGVDRCIVVLNKCDLVEKDWLELVKDEIKETFEGTFLENAPILEVSAKTGQGVDELVDKIMKVTDASKRFKDEKGIARLPIDRVFTLSGFGTIVTGTLASGTIKKNDMLEIYPTGLTAKIRSIQVHGEEQEICYAGQRVAINIPNIKKAEISRGNVLAPANNMQNTDLLDVKLENLISSKRIIKNNMRVHFFSGTDELLCRIKLLDCEQLNPGESGFAQLVMERKIALCKEDRFVIRFYSPLETIGGGVVLDAHPCKHKRHDENVLSKLEKQENGDVTDILNVYIGDAPYKLMEIDKLTKLTALPKEIVLEAITKLKEDGEVTVITTTKNGYIWQMRGVEEFCNIVIKKVGEYQKAYPYRLGYPKAQLWSESFADIKGGVFDELLRNLHKREIIVLNNAWIATPEFSVLRDETYDDIKARLMKTCEKARYNFVKLGEIEFDQKMKENLMDIVELLVFDDIIVKVDENVYTLTCLMNEAKQKIIGYMSDNDKITIADVRDMFETSRKSAKPILEYMCNIGILRKTVAESEYIK